MTLPTLIQNYQKMVLVNQLKRSMSTVSNGFKLAMADDEVDRLSDTKLFQSNTNEEFIYNLKKYFNILSIDDNGMYYWHNKEHCATLKNNACNDDVPPGPRVFLNNGSVLVFYNSVDNDGYTVVGIDTNGNKKPNQTGRDIFVFNINGHGKFKGYVGYDYCELNRNDKDCSQYLLENGFKMDY